MRQALGGNHQSLCQPGIRNDGTIPAATVITMAASVISFAGEDTIYGNS